jgi:hypothetical protein
MSFARLGLRLQRVNRYCFARVSLRGCTSKSLEPVTRCRRGPFHRRDSCGSPSGAHENENRGRDILRTVPAGAINEKDKPCQVGLCRLSGCQCVRFVYCAVFPARAARCGFLTDLPPGQTAPALYSVRCASFLSPVSVMGRVVPGSLPSRSNCVGSARVSDHLPLGLRRSYFCGQSTESPKYASRPNIGRSDRRCSLHP